MQAKTYWIFSLSVLLLTICDSALAQDPLTGPFRISRTTSQLFDPATAEAVSDLFAPDEEVQFQVYVPPGYDPGNPPGVFVFLDPRGWGGIPDFYWQLFSERNLIWIGPKYNERNPKETKKLFQVLIAERLIGIEYAVNLNRLYVGGSGDSVLTALNVLLGANQFKGALYTNGSAYWHNGRPENFEYLLRKTHVFLVGRGDDRWQRVRGDYQNYKEDGISNTHLITADSVIRDWPDVEQMAEALSILDAR